MIEMFDLRGKELKYAKEWNGFWIITENPYKIYEVAGHMWVELKLQVGNTYVICFEVMYTS